MILTMHPTSSAFDTFVRFDFCHMLMLPAAGSILAGVIIRPQRCWQVDEEDVEDGFQRMLWKVASSSILFATAAWTICQ